MISMAAEFFGFGKILTFGLFFMLLHFFYLLIIIFVLVTVPFIAIRFAFGLLILLILPQSYSVIRYVECIYDIIASGVLRPFLWRWRLRFGRFLGFCGILLLFRFFFVGHLSPVLFPSILHLICFEFRHIIIVLNLFLIIGHFIFQSFF